jgi:hypothetical protein
VEGRAAIGLDPGFASTVQTDQYHVFITEYDASNGLHVTARSVTGRHGIRPGSVASGGALLRGIRLHDTRATMNSILGSLLLIG